MAVTYKTIPSHKNFRLKRCSSYISGYTTIRWPALLFVRDLWFALPSVSPLLPTTGPNQRNFARLLWTITKPHALSFFSLSRLDGSGSFRRCQLTAVLELPTSLSFDAATAV